MGLDVSKMVNAAFLTAPDGRPVFLHGYWRAYPYAIPDSQTEDRLRRRYTKLVKLQIFWQFVLFVCASFCFQPVWRFALVTGVGLVVGNAFLRWCLLRREISSLDRLQPAVPRAFWHGQARSTLTTSETFLIAGTLSSVGVLCLVTWMLTRKSPQLFLIGIGLVLAAVAIVLVWQRNRNVEQMPAKYAFPVEPLDKSNSR